MFDIFYTHSRAHTVDLIKEGDNEAVEISQVQNKHSVNTYTYITNVSVLYDLI